MRTCPALAAAAAAALALPGCAAVPPDDPEPGSDQAALIGGELSSHPAVVYVFTPWMSCSGTLISPSVVLTAAHCLDGGPAEEMAVYFGDDASGGGRRVAALGASQHEGWLGGLQTNTQDFDIGLILLGAAQDPTIPVPLNTTPVTQMVGADYKVVGFGVNDQPTLSSDGLKREGMVVIDSVDVPPAGDDIILRDDSTFICFGDSGGPGFVTIDSVEYVAGVHSWTGNSNCDPPHGDTRVDLYVNDFLLPWIQDNDPACALDGTCARVGCIDDPDCQPCGPDGTCHEDCALPDYDCRTQDIGELCQVDSQCLSDLCIYWAADRSTHFCSRPCTGQDCPDGMSCETVQPFGMVCNYDEPPPGSVGDDCTTPAECGAYLCVDDRCVTECDLTIGVGCPSEFECRASGDGYYCFAIDDGGGGGCRTGGTSTLAMVCMIALLALGAEVRRRYRLEQGSRPLEIQELGLERFRTLPPGCDRAGAHTCSKRSPRLPAPASAVISENASRFSYNSSKSIVSWNDSRYSHRR